MSLRNFLRLLIKGVPESGTRVRHGGHEIADTVRDAMGPQAGGGGQGAGGGRMTGNAVYKHFERTLGPNHPDED